MTISQTTNTFFGKRVVDYRPGVDVSSLDSTVFRLNLDFDEDLDMGVLLEDFLREVDCLRLDALIIGMWQDAYQTSAQVVIDHLIAHSAHLPALRALFIGDMTFEQCEISWIVQGSYKGLLDAFPQLEVLRVRGSTDLVIEACSHTHLQQLIIECGGLPSAIVRNLAQSHLPALQHLELWLGSDSYGFDGDVALYANMLECLQPARLRYLGLRDAEISDDLAGYIAQQPWLASLETLDLSLGTLGDVGAEALFHSPYIKGLQKLDISHHYVSGGWLAKLATLPISLVADEAEDAEETDGDRYVAVSE